MTKVTAPNKQYTGLSAGVPFVNGVGETSDPHLISWFKGHGYEVEEPKEPEETPKEPKEPEQPPEEPEEPPKGEKQGAKTTEDKPDAKKKGE